LSLFLADSASVQAQAGVGFIMLPLTAKPRESDTRPPMATRSASFEALVLRSKEVPSGARVVTLLSAEDGLVEAFVFGGGKSKLRSLASPWHRGTAWIYRDAAKDFIKLTDFDARREYPGIRADLHAISVASFASEFITATSALGGDWADAFALMTDLLASLDDAVERHDDEAVDRTLALFSARALEIMGLAPDLRDCVSCAGAIQDDALHSYSRRLGGFVCGRCATPDLDLVQLPEGVLAWLRVASQRSFGDAIRVGLGREALAALKAYSLDMAKKAADAPLRTLDSGLL